MLFALASAYLRLGLFIPIEWVDEGVIVYAIWRVAEGDLPYRDFQQMYPPSLFFLGGFLFRLFGSDLAVLRYLVLATKAATCVMVYVGARRISGRAFALIAYAVAVALLGIAWPILTTPYASFFGAALCLAGLLSFLAFERRLFYGCAIAGLCFGIAATFKQTTGAFAFLALALFLLVDEGQGGSRPGRILATLVRTSRWFVILFTAAVSVFYLAPRNPLGNLTLLLAPVLFLTGHLALRELRRPPAPENQLQTFWGLVALTLAFLLPLVAYATLYVSLGLGAEILFNTVSGIPPAVSWISPFPAPTITFVLWQVAGFGAFASHVIWRGHAAETLRGRRLWTFRGLLAVSLLALIALAVQGWQARAAAYWFWASSDLLFSLPFVLVWLSIAEVVRLGRVEVPSGSVGLAGQRRAFVLFTAYATMSLLWLYPAADIWHILGVLPSCLPLLAYLLERFWQLPGETGRNPRSRRLGAAVLIGAFCLAVVLPAAVDLLRAWRAEPAFVPSLPRATGVLGVSRPASFHASGGDVVRYLNHEERRDEPIFVLSGKSLFYFLTDRVSPVQESEFVLYMAANGSIHEETARELLDEAELIRRLREVRPLIIDDGSDDRGENVRLMYPRLASFVRANYRLEKKFGRFQVLSWRSPVAPTPKS